jgi:hypothetical protein
MGPSRILVERLNGEDEKKRQKWVFLAKAPPKNYGATVNAIKKDS